MNATAPRYLRAYAICSLLAGWVVRYPSTAPVRFAYCADEREARERADAFNATPAPTR